MIRELSWRGKEPTMANSRLTMVPLVFLCFFFSATIHGTAPVPASHNHRHSDNYNHNHNCINPLCALCFFFRLWRLLPLWLPPPSTPPACYPVRPSLLPLNHTSYLEHKEPWEASSSGIYFPIISNMKLLPT